MVPLDPVPSPYGVVRSDPRPAGLTWPAMTPEDRKYLRVDQQLSVREKLHEDRLQVWEELYPMEY